MKHFYSQGSRNKDVKAKKANWLLQSYYPLGAGRGLSGRLPSSADQVIPVRGETKSWFGDVGLSIRTPSGACCLIFFNSTFPSLFGVTEDLEAQSSGCFRAFMAVRLSYFYAVLGASQVNSQLLLHNTTTLSYRPRNNCSERLSLLPRLPSCEGGLLTRASALPASPRSPPPWLTEGLRKTHPCPARQGPGPCPCSVAPGERAPPRGPASRSPTEIVLETLMVGWRRADARG